MIDFEDQVGAAARDRDSRRSEHDLMYPGGRCRRCGIGPHEAGEQLCNTLLDSTDAKRRSREEDPSDLLNQQAEFIQRMWITWCDTGDERYWRAYHRALQDSGVEDDPRLD